MPPKFLDPLGQKRFFEPPLPDTSWGRSVTFTPFDNAFPDPIDPERYVNLIEVTQPIELTSGFNLTLLPPPTLTGNQWMSVIVEYGGGGIASVSRQFDICMPLTMVIPGKTIRVRGCLAVIPFMARVAQYMGAFATPLPRDIIYPLAIGKRLDFPAGIAPGLWTPQISLVGRSVKAVQYATQGPTPIVIQLQCLGPMGGFGFTDIAHGPATAATTLPYIIPANASALWWQNVDVNPLATMYYTLIEEL